MDFVRSDGGGSLATEVASTADAFAQLRAEWDALLEDSAQQVYFLRHHWNELWWQHYAPAGSQLHIVCCRDSNGRLMGIAPLYRRPHRIFGIPYVSELSFIGTGIELKTSEYLDVVARRGYERPVAEAIAAELKRSDRWDRLWLHQVPAESAVMPHLVQALKKDAHVYACDRAPYIDTSGDWENYKRQLGRSMRRNVEYYGRRLFKRYSCEFAHVRSLTEVREAMAALVELHQARWQASGHPGSFSDPGFVSLLTEAAARDFDTGRLRLWTLKMDGKIEAALLGFLDRGVLHYFQKGFNPTYSKEDLGTAMLGLCIRDSFDDPAIHAFDFMGGGAGYKELWARSARETNACKVSRSNMRAQLYMLREKIRHASTIAFRAVVPLSLRAARRDYLRRQRLKRQVPSAEGKRQWHWLMPLCWYAGELVLQVTGLMHQHSIFL